MDRMTVVEDGGWVLDGEGAFVLYEDAQSRIAELEAEVARLTALNDGNKEIAGKLVVEKFALLDKLEAAENTAWNDAIDAAAAKSKEGWNAGYDPTPHIRAIRR